MNWFLLLKKKVLISRTVDIILGQLLGFCFVEWIKFEARTKLLCAAEGILEAERGKRGGETLSQEK